jgi:hypothetical protein
MTKLLLSLLAAALVARGEFNPRQWHWRQPVRVTPGVELSSVSATAEMYRGSSRLADVRIVRDGIEVPYLVRTLDGKREEREIRSEISNQSASSEGVQATLDTGGNARHNRVRLAVNRTNFKQTVRIETSSDGRHWDTARTDGLIFDASDGDNHTEALTVDYPASTQRFVRVTILGWKNPSDLASIRLTCYEETAEVRDVLAETVPVLHEDERTKAAVWTSDTGYEGLPRDSVAIGEPASREGAGAGLFYRRAEVETSPDGKVWAYAGQGEFSRTATGESLAIAFPEHWDRYLRLRIHNGDKPPLLLKRLALRAYRREFVFAANSPGRYWIYYGNPAAKQPSYDFAHVIPAAAKPEEASVGAQEQNPVYIPPEPPLKPWTDRHPAMLYTILSAAILGLGYGSVKFLLRLRASAGRE